MKNMTTGKKDKIPVSVEKAKALAEKQLKKKLASVPTDFAKWQAVCPLKPITRAEENEVALATLAQLAELSNEGMLTANERDYYRVLRILVQHYESKVVKPIDKPSPGEMLEFLMEINELKQLDLVDVLGSQSTVSNILSNKRVPTIEQAYDLGKRFAVNHTLFIADPRNITPSDVDRRGGKAR
jgi:antitoxin component HigA of HigAB toxin-antitoxin module